MRMKLSLALIAPLILPAILASSAWAQGGSAADEKAIRAIEARWEAAWNSHDVVGMVATYASDADAVNLAGEWFQGRDAFQKSLEELHAGKTQGSVWEMERTEIKFLTPQIAVVHVYVNSHGDRHRDGSSMPPRHVILTRVDVKRGGEWLIVASQATNIVPRASAQVGTSASRNAGE
jgi:uncharacterized protein (TIGR02246 family)